MDDSEAIAQWLQEGEEAFARFGQTLLISRTNRSQEGVSVVVGSPYSSGDGVEMAGKVDIFSLLP